MNKETLAALDASIKHWEENARAETPEEANVDGRACALCNMFNDLRSGDISCRRCPVMWATGWRSCAGTPYQRAAIAFYDWSSGHAVADQFREAALAELNFLKAIRPIGL